MCYDSATMLHMTVEVSIRELRNHTARVIAAVEAGEEVVLTSHNRRIADIVPHTEQRSPWMTARALREIRREAGSDPTLMDDLADVRGAMIETGE